MITKENFKEVVELLNDKDREVIRNSDKEYVVLHLHSTNCGSWTTFELTDNLSEHEDVPGDGGCIVEVLDVIEIIGEDNEI